ncbi:MAG: MFS transporter [Gammaproteobacteria bacterium]
MQFPTLKKSMFLLRIFSAPARHAPLLLMAMTLGLAYGIWYAYSVFLVALLAEFEWSRSVLAGAFSLFAVVHGISNPLVGSLCDRVRPPILIGIGGLGISLSLWFTSYIESPLQLYIGFGGMTALSVALCGWVPAVVVVQRRYIHRLGFALGIASAGIGVGMLVVVPICQVLIEQMGWRTAYRALGTICGLIMIPTAIYLLFSPRHKAPVRQPSKPSQSRSNRVPTKSITPREALTMPTFWLIFIGFVGGSTCSQTLHVHQVAFFVDQGIGALVAASVVSVVGFCSIVGKVGGGWLSDKISRELIFIGSTVILLASVASLLWVQQSPSLIGAFAFGVLLGIGYAAVAAIMPAMMSDRFSGSYYGTILGFGLFGSAMGSAFGPWMAGVLFDLTGSYTLPFLVAGACGVIAIISVFFAYRIRLGTAARSA